MQDQLINGSFDTFEQGFMNSELDVKRENNLLTFNVFEITDGNKLNPSIWARKMSKEACTPQLQNLLKHNLFKNVSKGPAFLWQAQIQTIEYGLNDAI